MLDKLISIHIDDRYFNHLHLTNDIAKISGNELVLEKMLIDLVQVQGSKGYRKTKYCGTANIISNKLITHTSINDTIIRLPWTSNQYRKFKLNG